MGNQFWVLIWGFTSERLMFLYLKSWLATLFMVFKLLSFNETHFFLFSFIVHNYVKFILK